MSKTMNREQDNDEALRWFRSSIQNFILIFRSKNYRIRSGLKSLLKYLVMSLGGVVMVFPLVWMILSAFKPSGQIISYPPVWIPKPWVLTNFLKALELIDLKRLFLNSLFQATMATVLTLLTSSLSGYVFAKFRFPGRNVLFIAILATMMIPWPIYLLPQYVLIVKLKLVDTPWALILPAVYSSFGIFMMRQFMHTIPDEMLDAARIDGAGEQRIFWQIVIPNCQPALAALGIFTFLWNWDSFLWPLIVINRQELYTLPVGLGLAVGQYWTDYGMIMAGATISVFPVLVVYLIFQHRFVEGVVLTGIKG